MAGFMAFVGRRCGPCQPVRTRRLVRHVVRRSPDARQRIRGPSEGGCLDAWTLLPAVAAITSAVPLGSLVAPVTLRHPATLASAATTLAPISTDRFVLGVGAGWQANELRRTASSSAVLESVLAGWKKHAPSSGALLDDAQPRLEGDHFTVRRPTRRPRPQTRIPLLIGGNGELRTLRTVALYADEWNGWCDAELFVRKRVALAKHCETLGRDPSEVRCSVNTFLAMHDDPARVQRLRTRARDRPVLAGSPQQVSEQLHELKAAPRSSQHSTAAKEGPPHRRSRGVSHAASRGRAKSASFRARSCAHQNVVQNTSRWGGVWLEGRSLADGEVEGGRDTERKSQRVDGLTLLG